MLKENPLIFTSLLYFSNRLPVAALAGHEAAAPGHMQQLGSPLVLASAGECVVTGRSNGPGT